MKTSILRTYIGVHKPNENVGMLFYRIRFTNLVFNRLHAIGLEMLCSILSNAGNLAKGDLLAPLLFLSLPLPPVQLS